MEHKNRRGPAGGGSTGEQARRRPPAEPSRAALWPGKATVGGTGAARDKEGRGRGRPPEGGEEGREPAVGER